jgi:hypothetical protein
MQAAHPVVAAAMLEAPRQQIADRVEIAGLDLAKTGFGGEHRVYHGRKRSWGDRIVSHFRSIMRLHNLMRRRNNPCQ